jgi:hypothetical protein
MPAELGLVQVAMLKLRARQTSALEYLTQLADSKLSFSPNILFQPSASSGVATIRSTVSGIGV